MNFVIVGSCETHVPDLNQRHVETTLSVESSGQTAWPATAHPLDVSSSTTADHLDALDLTSPPYTRLDFLMVGTGAVPASPVTKIFQFSPATSLQAGAENGSCDPSESPEMEKLARSLFRMAFRMRAPPPEVWEALTSFSATTMLRAGLEEYHTNGNGDRLMLAMRILTRNPRGIVEAMRWLVESDAAENEFFLELILGEEFSPQEQMQLLMLLADSSHGGVLERVVEVCESVPSHIGAAPLAVAERALRAVG